MLHFMFNLGCRNWTSCCHHRLLPDGEWVNFTGFLVAKDVGSTVKSLGMNWLGGGRASSGILILDQLAAKLLVMDTSYKDNEH